MDFLSVVGLVIGVGAIFVGQHLEGGHVSSLINGPAFLIVVGGSLGAGLLQSRFDDFARSMISVLKIFFPPVNTRVADLRRILGWSQLARREGLLGLEPEIASLSDNFQRKGLQLLVDGTDGEQIRQVLLIDSDIRRQQEGVSAAFFESMGGYAPTVGILGAVLGLIHTMENLSDPARLGEGIATAFVATIYGVGLANLVLIPLAGKMRRIAQQEADGREMIIEGLVAIAEGENPRNIELLLEAFL